MEMEMEIETEMEMENANSPAVQQLLAVLAPSKLQSPLNSATVPYKARQTRFIVSHQRPLPLRPAASTVIIVFRAMTRAHFNGYSATDLPSIW